jgi:colicin import membrane protein
VGLAEEIGEIERAREAGAEARRATALAEARAREAGEQVSAVLLEQKEERAAAERAAAGARTAMGQVVQRAAAAAAAAAAAQQEAAVVAAAENEANEAKGVAEERVRQLEALIEAQRVELLRLRGAGVLVADASAP